MRLAPFRLLIPATALSLAAQAPLPPWRLAADPAAPPALEGPEVPVERPLVVRIQKDGSFHIRTHRGHTWMRGGLPGRPLKVWRDGGLPVADPFAPLAMASVTPLSTSAGAIPVGERDLRRRFTGLIWVLEDSETMLTVLHPATRRMISLRLPDIDHPQIAFHPDRLVVTGGTLESGQVRKVAWELHWVALLASWVELARPPKPMPLGTALEPFVRE